MERTLANYNSEKKLLINDLAEMEDKLRYK